MAKRYEQLNDELIGFIAAQPLYFVGTAANDGTINVSPKGFDSLRVLSPTRVVWMNLTGSGNETAAHLQQNHRLTMMFCAFEGRPKILRLYGKAQVVHPRDPAWQELSSLFPAHKSARQCVDFSIELVQTSCGFGVGLFDYQGERDNMHVWLANKDESGLRDYWREKNQVSLDGLPTHILEDEAN